MSIGNKIYLYMARAAILVLPALMLSPLTTVKGQSPGGKTEVVWSSYDTIPAGFRDKLIQYYYTEGIKSYSIDKDNRRALSNFDKAIQLDPTHAPSYFQAANAAMTFDPSQALWYSGKAVELDSSNTWYASQNGRLAIMTGRYSDARRIYEKLIVMEPRSPENYAMLAMLYERTGQPYAAIATLEKAENVIGRIEQLSKHKRDMLILAGLTDQAIREGEAIAKTYPYNYEGYLFLAELYAETRKDSLAELNYSKALELNPDGLDIIASMNEFYRISGNSVKYLESGKRLVQSPDLEKETKIRLFRDITSDRNFYRDHYFHIRNIASTLFIIYPDDYDIVALYASNIRAWGNFDEASDIHKQYIATPRSQIDPYMDVVGMEAYMKRADSVKKYSQIALERFPTDPELHIRLGGTYSYMGNEKEALKAFEKALKHVEGDSARSVVLGVIGDEYHKQGNDKKSYKYYDQALSLWDGNTVVLNNYAYFLSVEGKELGKALSMARKVMDQEPSNPTYIDTYAWVLFKMGRLEEAKAAMRKAVSLDASNSSELLIHYGDILYALGDEYMATVYWKRALDAGHDEDEVNGRLEKAGM
ncbi:MAG: tetratricopeptide repeat protein [Alistipes sp.]|nr:tetratricopeptide repeat protein [Alistipes sp.]